MQNKYFIKTPKSDLVFDGICVLFLTILFIAVAYPLYFVVIASVSDPVQVGVGSVKFWPVGFNLECYRMIMEYKDIWVGYANSVLYTLAGTVLNVMLTLMAAYPLSRGDFKPRKIIMLFFTFTMFFGGGLIPSYMLISKMKLIDTFWVMILLGAVSVYNIIITKTFFQSSIPLELYESASLDGCSDARYFFSIMLPISKAIIAVLVVFYAVGHWNGFFNAMIYLNDRDRFPLQLILREILTSAQSSSGIDIVDENDLLRAMTAETLKYGVIIVASVPMLILYPFVQKYFVKGVMIGAIKG